MIDKTSALFWAKYAVVTLFVSLVYRVGALPTFCIVQGVMTVMVSVSVHGLYILKTNCFWCQNEIYLVSYLYKNVS